MMAHLPESPDLSHLKKQAKQLLRAARAGEAAALLRFVEALPAARGVALKDLAERDLLLSDAQSVIAREVGFRLWVELKRYVEWKQVDRAERLKVWLEWVYEGGRRERRLAARMVAEEPGFFAASDPWLACAIGDVDGVRAEIARDAGWVNRKGGSLGMPPLVAVTHSRLVLEDGFEGRLVECARILLAAGADVNSRWLDPKWPDGEFSALYGAAGRTHCVAMVRALLDAGADTEDNESLYHSVETRESTVTRMLLDAGARVVGTNAMGRVMDFSAPNKLEDLKRMLACGGDAREKPWVHHAILRGRSMAHVRVLVDAGADLRAVNRDGVSLFRFAQMHGRADVVDLLREAGVAEDLSLEEEFVGACARGDEARARELLGRETGIFGRLTAKQMGVLPEMAEVGNMAAVRTMLAVGWPLEAKASWDATALNLAVYRGAAAMARVLLEAGADWRTLHGFKDNVVGALSHASLSGPEDVGAEHDFVGCARALVEHGVPLKAMEDYTFSPEVEEYLAAVRLRG
jgi:ankyrin repeat protein